jgi:mono/diheme cytochrome c family protein
MRVVAVVVGIASLTGCDSGTDQRADVASTRVVMRPHAPFPPDVVPRGSAATAVALASPGPSVTPALLERGRDRFAVFCTPCHGANGHGDGTVVSRGFPAPPSYHDERLRQVAPEHIVRIITSGTGRMYPYADRVPAEDRWAIAHHVKALQAQERRPASPQ